MLTSNIALGTGKKTLNGDVQLFFSTETSIRPERGITILAGTGNSSTAWVGFNSGITSGTNDDTDGFPIVAGASLLISIRNPNDMWIVGTSGDLLHWISE